MGKKSFLGDFWGRKGKLIRRREKERKNRALRRKNEENTEEKTDFRYVIILLIF